MPIDLEMLMSSPGHTFFLYPPYDTTSYADSAYDRNLSFPQRHCVPRPLAKHQELFRKKSLSDLFINSASSNSKNGSVSKELSNATRKKKVSFADDKGFNLVEVREIPNAPKWADDVITLLIGNTTRSVVKEKKWRVAFNHPPWSDDKLVEKLERNMVALEYVSVKEEAEDVLFGTVKVKNIAYEKKVFIRVTYDRWQSYVNIPCTYMKPSEKVEIPKEYDTFCFDTKILPISSRYEVIEFCVCYMCSGKEYWDNNGDINYRLIFEYSKSSVMDSYQPSTPKSFKATPQFKLLGKNDEYASEMDIWRKMIHNEAYW